MENTYPEEKNMDKKTKDLSDDMQYLHYCLKGLNEEESSKSIDERNRKRLRGYDVYFQSMKDVTTTDVMFRPSVSVAWNDSFKRLRTYSPLFYYSSIKDSFIFFHHWNKMSKKNIAFVSDRRIDVFHQGNLVGSFGIEW